MMLMMMKVVVMTMMMVVMMMVVMKSCRRGVSSGPGPVCEARGHRWPLAVTSSWRRQGKSCCPQ